MNRVLVPLDGSRLSEQVLGPVLTLVRSANGNVTLFHAVTPAESFSVSASQWVQQERRRSAAYLQDLAQRVCRDGNGVQERIVTGEASREIVAEARRSRADLIAMSSHGRSGVCEGPFGSIAERVLRTTNTPILVFRGALSRAYAIRTIVFAWDGSEESLEVAAPAADLAASVNATVLLVHAGKNFPSLLPRVLKIFSARGVACRFRLLNGEPAQAILASLAEEKADLLALTTTGKTSRDQIFFGRVAEEILRKADLPLLVVHTGRVA
jgi:nucleotide-binding universal stress UspA family protein